MFDKSAMGEEGGDLYDQAVAVVMRDRKASTSYIQRRLQIGYNRAASLMERMENEGLVGPANHAGKRDILMDGRGGGIEGLLGDGHPSRPAQRPAPRSAAGQLRETWCLKNVILRRRAHEPRRMLKPSAPSSPPHPSSSRTAAGRPGS